MEESLRPSGKMRVFRYILSLGSLFINVKNQQRKRKGDVEEQRSLENVVACSDISINGNRNRNGNGNEFFTEMESKNGNELEMELE